LFIDKLTDVKSESEIEKVSYDAVWENLLLTVSDTTDFTVVCALLSAHYFSPYGNEP